MEKFKARAGDLTKWVKERRPDDQANGAILRVYYTGLDSRLSDLSDANLPDDLEAALANYVAAFRENPILVAAKGLAPDEAQRLASSPTERMRLIHRTGKQSAVYAEKLAPARARLRDAAAKHGVNMDEIIGR